MVLYSAISTSNIECYGIQYAAEKTIYVHTDGGSILHTLLVKHYNDLLDRQTSERDKDKVTCFYVEDIFCIHLGTKYADFQEKIFPAIFS